MKQRKRNGLMKRTRKPRQIGEVGQFAEDAWSLGKRAFKGVNALRKLINIEFKRFDTTDTGRAMSQAGAVLQMSQIPQGLDRHNRVGDSIRTQYLKFSGQIFISGSAIRSIARVMIVRDKENLGSAPAGSDILTTAGTSNATSCGYNYFNTSIGSTGGRFTVLYDEAVALSVTGDQSAYLHFQTPLSQHIRYSGSGATATREGSLWVVLLTNESTNVPTIDWDAQLQFTDD